MTHSYPTRRSSDLLDIGSTGENAVVDGIALGDHRCPHARLIGGKTTRQLQPHVDFRIGAALLLPPQRIVNHRHRAVHSVVPARKHQQHLPRAGPYPWTIINGPIDASVEWSTAGDGRGSDVGICW